MLQKIVHKIARPHHPWRTMKFDELAEIYASMSLRYFGLGVIGIFVPIFLYKIGYDLRAIFFFFTVFFGVRPFINYASAHVVGRIGPKHAIAVSTVLNIMFLLLLLTLELFGWPLLVLAVFYSAGQGLFFIGYHTDFSKVNDSKHGGKELGWLYIFERAGSAIGPVVGGFLAQFFSPLVSIGFAILVLIGSLVPLFLSSEPVRLHQKIDFEGFKWRRHTRNTLALSGFHIENVATLVMWPLFIGITVFSEDTYAKLGTVIGLALLVSMFSARMIGKTIDNRRGRNLLRFGALLNAFTHVIRAFITNGSGVVAVTTLNEPTTLSYRMPLTKGYYDAADGEEGHRIVYITFTEICASIAKAAFCLSLFVFSYFYNPISVLQYSFIVVGVLSLVILLERFPALNKV